MPRVPDHGSILCNQGDVDSLFLPEGESKHGDLVARDYCNPSAEQMISFCNFFLEYIALISPPTVIIDRFSITARKTESACGNSMHLFIGFLFESHASLSKRAVQLLAWLRIFVSSRSKIRPVCTHCGAMRDAFTLQFLIADLCSLILVGYVPTLVKPLTFYIKVNSF